MILKQAPKVELKKLIKMETLIETLTNRLKFQYEITVKAVNEFVENHGSKTFEFACRNQQEKYNRMLEDAVKTLVNAGMTDAEAFDTVVKINENVELKK